MITGAKNMPANTINRAADPGTHFVTIEDQNHPDGKRVIPIADRKVGSDYVSKAVAKSGIGKAGDSVSNLHLGGVAQTDRHLWGIISHLKGQLKTTGKITQSDIYKAALKHGHEDHREFYKEKIRSHDHTNDFEWHRDENFGKESEEEQSKSPDTAQISDLDKALERWVDYSHAYAIRENQEGRLGAKYTGIDGSTWSKEDLQQVKGDTVLIQKAAKTQSTGFNTLYKGVVVDGEKGLRSTYKVGKEFKTDHLTATSAKEDYAKIYADPENFAFYDNGIGAVLEFRSSGEIGGVNAQDGQESILPKGASFVVQSIDTESSPHRVVLVPKNEYKPAPKSKQIAPELDRSTKFGKKYQEAVTRLFGEHPGEYWDEEDLPDVHPEVSKQLEEIFGKGNDDENLQTAIDLIAPFIGEGVAVGFGERDGIEVRSAGHNMRMEREIVKGNNGELVVIHHDLFMWQGENFKYKSGDGLVAFNEAVRRYRAAGADRIEIPLAFRSPSHNGYYTWAVFGADGDVPDRVSERFEDEFGRTPQSVSDIIKDPKAGPQWWKDNGDTFHATFDLNDGSKHLKMLEDYIKGRADRENNPEIKRRNPSGDSPRLGRVRCEELDVDVDELTEFYEQWIKENGKDSAGAGE